MLCGDAEAWNVARLEQLVERFSGLVKIHYLSVRTFPGAFTDVGDVLTLLGVQDAAQYLVRPDGYIAFRCGGRDLDAMTRYLSEWFARPGGNATG